MSHDENPSIEDLVASMDKLDPSIRDAAIMRLGFVPEEEFLEAEDEGTGQNATGMNGSLGDATPGPSGAGNPILPHSYHSVGGGAVGNVSISNPPPFGQHIPLGYPRLSTFSGEDVSKGDVKFSRWKYEVQSLLQSGQADSIVLQSIRRSVRGTAAEVITTMPFAASAADVLHKFEGFFGDVLPGEKIMRNLLQC